MASSRKFRSKLSISRDDDEPEAGGGTAVRKGAASKASTPSLLSFGEDEEEIGAVAIKKPKGKPKTSKFHQPALKGSHAAAAPSSSTHTQRPSAGEYTADRLRELQQGTQRLPAGRHAPPSGSVFGEGLKLSGSFKPVKTGHVVAAPAAAPPAPPPPSQQADDDDFLPPPPPRRVGGAATANSAAAASPAAAAASAASRAAVKAPPGVAEGMVLAGDDAEAAEEEDYAIPDARTIQLVKAKRERLRQAHLAPDYIPLGGTTKVLAGAGSKGLAMGDYEAADEAAAQGEGGDVSDDADEDERLRMQFIGNPAAASGRPSKGVAGKLVAETEEEESFADEQLRKAIRRNAGAGASTSAPAAAAPAPAASRGDDVSTAAAMALGAPSKRSLAQVQAAADGVVAALQEALRRLQTSHGHTQTHLARTKGSLASALEGIERVQADIAATGEKFAYVQKIKAYVADLCDCLADKAPLVEELEEALVGLQEERAAAAAAQQRADMDALMAQGDVAVSAALAVLGQGGALAAAATAAQQAADAVAAQESASRANGSHEEVDEFGRSVGMQQHREIQEAAVRRGALLQEQQRRLNTTSAGGRLALDAPDLPEGGDPGAAAEAARYARRRGEVMEAASTVFADASEEFASLPAVARRLDEFKSRYSRDYDTSYMALSAPALFAPFVRLELLRWDPLWAESPGFDSQQWYGVLFDYGVKAGNAAQSDADADANLVPQLVEQLVLPRVLRLVAKCWDPFHVGQTRAVASLVADVLVYAPSDHEGVQELLGLVTAALEDATGRALVPPWPPAATAASALAAGVQMLRFARAARLLAGMMGFRELLDQQLLTRLGLGRLLQVELMPFMRAAAAAGPGGLAAAVARAEAVVPSVPREWCRHGAVPVEVRPLVELLGGLARALEAGRGQSDGVDRAALAARVAPLLAHVGGAERAQALATAFGLALPSP